jgi:hypothetical protein
MLTYGESFLRYAALNFTLSYFTPWLEPVSTVIASLYSCVGIWAPPPKKTDGTLGHVVEPCV